MKRKIFSILFALVLVLSFSLVTAVPVGAQDYLGMPPTIDGDLSEWEAAGTQYIYADGCLGRDQIGTGKLYMAFDDDNFYLAYKLEDAGAGDDYLYAFNGGFWFPDASGYNSSEPLPSEHVLTDAVLELRQSWEGIRGAGAVYGEWMIEIVSNNAARIIRFGSMQATTGLVTNLTFYAGSYDGEDPFPGSYIPDGLSKDDWIMTGFSVLDPYFGQYSVAPAAPAPKAGAGKAPLYNSVGFTCDGGASDTSGPTYGFVILNTNASGDLIVEVALKGATPKATYDIWVNQSPGACPLKNPTAPSALSTNIKGNGNAHVEVARVDGATNFWVSAVGGGQVLRSTAVVLD